MHVLGIDGGGTKTAFTLFDRTAEGLVELDRLVLGTCHFAQVGMEGMEGVLARGVSWARELAARHAAAPDAPLQIAFAICGYGEDPAQASRIDLACARVADASRHIVVNDVEAAWAAGLELADGIALIAGTGSIAYGRRAGRSMRCGGWDYLLGDEGSGGWMGKELLRAFTRQADGRDPRGPLHGLVRSELALADDFGLIAFAQRHFADRGRIAALAPLVERAARAGDASALGIFSAAAREEADTVRAVARALFGDGGDGDADGHDAGIHDAAPIPVAYVGGTFKAGELILGPLARELGPGFELRAPRLSPEAGAALLLEH